MIQAQPGWIIFEMIEDSPNQEGKVLIADTLKLSSLKGKALSVGVEVTSPYGADIYPQVEKGEIFIYRSGSIDSFYLEGKLLCSVGFQDVVAVVKEDNGG